MINASVTSGNRSAATLSLSGITGSGLNQLDESRGRYGSSPRALDGHMLVGVVAGAHERSSRHVLEAELVSGLLELLELVRMPVAHDRQVILGGAQVLTERQHLDVMRAEGPQRVDHLLEAFAQPDHQARLRDHLVSAQLLGVAQHAAGALKPRSSARKRI